MVDDGRRGIGARFGGCRRCCRRIRPGWPGTHTSPWWRSWAARGGPLAANEQGQRTVRPSSRARKGSPGRERRCDDAMMRRCDDATTRRRDDGPSWAPAQSCAENHRRWPRIAGHVTPPRARKGDLPRPPLKLARASQLGVGGAVFSIYEGLMDWLTARGVLYRNVILHALPRISADRWLPSRRLDRGPTTAECGST